jgi:hypothetical protein
MTNNNRGNFEYCREDVYARLRRYTAALDNPDDRVIAILARAELPRYVRYWVGLLAEHEPTASGTCQPVPTGGTPCPRHATRGSGRLGS